MGILIYLQKKTKYLSDRNLGRDENRQRGQRDQCQAHLLCSAVMKITCLF